MYSPPGVEDPISAIFDLSDRVAEMAPTIRRMYRYTATVTVVFLAIMVILLFVGLVANLFFSVLALIAIVFGVIALSLLRETDRFYQAYLSRHRSIKLLQEADPTPKVPDGPTPVQRLARYLSASNPRVAEQLRRHPESLRYRVRFGNGTGGMTFDLALVARGTAAGRWIGWGDAGFAILARQFTGPLGVAELDRFAADVVSASRRIGPPIVRVIALRTSSEPTSEPVHDFAVGHPIELRGGRVPVEIVTEEPGGSYDLVPHVLGVP